MSPSAGTFTMGYGYEGLRLWQQGGDGSVASFVYDGENVLSWQKGGTLTQVLVQGEGILRSVGLTESGAALNRIYHADGQGTTVATTTGNQALETEYQTDAWGNTLAGGATDNPYIYGGGGGYWQEPELGLTYVGARWLEPKTGSWLSVDPVVGEPAYSYAYNSPTAYMDPTGTQGEYQGMYSSQETFKGPPSGLDMALWNISDNLRFTKRGHSHLGPNELTLAHQYAGALDKYGHPYFDPAQRAQIQQQWNAAHIKKPVPQAPRSGHQNGSASSAPHRPHRIPHVPHMSPPVSAPVHVAPAVPPVHVAPTVPHLDAKQRRAYEQNLQELQRDVLWGKQWGMLDQGLAYVEGGMQGLLIAQVALSDAATFGLLSRLNIVSEDVRNQDGYQFSYHSWGAARDAGIGIFTAGIAEAPAAGRGLFSLGSRLAPAGSWLRPSFAPSLFGQTLSVARPLAYAARGLQAGQALYGGYESIDHIRSGQGSGWDWLNLGLTGLMLGHWSFSTYSRGTQGLYEAIFDWEGASARVGRGVAATEAQSAAQKFSRSGGKLVTIIRDRVYNKRPNDFHTYILTLLEDAFLKSGGKRGNLGLDLTNPSQRGYFIASSEFNNGKPYIAIHPDIVEGSPEFYEKYNEELAHAFITGTGWRAEISYWGYKNIHFLRSFEEGITKYIATGDLKGAFLYGWNYPFP